MKKKSFVDVIVRKGRKDVSMEAMESDRQAEVATPGTPLYKAEQRRLEKEREARRKAG